MRYEILLGTDRFKLVCLVLTMLLYTKINTMTSVATESMSLWFQ